MEEGADSVVPLFPPHMQFLMTPFHVLNLQSQDIINIYVCVCVRERGSRDSSVV
jgi:hypothetical protein